MTESELSSHVSDMKLAHPQRLEKTLGGTQFLEFLDTLPAPTRQLFDALLSSDKTLAQIANEFATDPRGRPLAPLFALSNASPGATGTAGSSPMLAGMRQLTNPAPMFLLDDKLLQLLQNTDISDEIPLSCLQPPFARTFIEFGKKREDLPFVPNAETGLHVLESAYLEIGEDPEIGPHLSILFMGSPLGKAHLADDASMTVFLMLGNPEQPVLEALEESFHRANAASKYGGLNLQDESWLGSLRELSRLLVKAVLYIGLPGIRREVHNDRKALLEQLGRIKSGGKRAKLERKLTKTYDYVLIQPPPDVATSGAAGDGHRSPKQHWRRGHLRMQRHGPEHSLTKLIFISPVLVGVDLAEHSAPTYRVK